MSNFLHEAVRGSYVGYMYSRVCPCGPQLKFSYILLKLDPAQPWGAAGHFYTASTEFRKCRRRNPSFSDKTIRVPAIRTVQVSNKASDGRRRSLA